ncbi:MAG: ABC transporter ATP-binding protein [Peptostreptococcales bacterium]
MDNNNIIVLKNIYKTFDDNLVLDNINISIKEGEFVTFLGPSGCGKTTTLRIIGGFEHPDEGEVIFEDKVINNLSPDKRNINTVFQKYALFSHLNVFDNIAFGPKIAKVPKEKIEEDVLGVLKIVGLSGFENREIKTLSGGQQQRVAIARAIINRPKVLLLDEPLGALDLKLRKEMQLELKKIHKEIGITFIYVTHDQEEAMTLSDTIVVMKDGVIQQIGSSTDIYNEPNNRFVAGFIGESNTLSGYMVKDFEVELQGKKIPCVDKGFDAMEPVDIVIRPEDIEFTTEDKAYIKGTVTSVVFKGVHYEMMIDDGHFQWMSHNTKMYEEGSEIFLYFTPENIHIMKKGEKDE